MTETTEKRISLKAQSAWLLFAKVISFVFSTLLPLLIVRFLTQSQVGEYRQVFQVITNATVILSLGFGMSAYYFLAREKERHAAVIFNILLFNFVLGGLACLTLILYPQLIGNIFQDKETTRLMPTVGVVIWLWMFSTFLEIAAVANQEARLATTFIIFAQFSKTVLMVSAVVLFASVEAFLYAAIVQGSIQTIVLLVYLNSRFPRFWLSFDARFFREQLIYALPFGFAGLLWTLQTDIHNYFVGHRFSSAEFAVYSIGCFDLPLIAMLYESIASVLIPRMSQLQAEDDKPEMIHLLARTMQTLAFFYFPIFMFLSITAETFITTLFTTKYAESVPIFLINITLLPAYIWIADPVIRAYKDLGRLLLIIRVFIFIGLVTALYFGIQYFDLRGMILIVVIVALIDKIVSTALVLWKLNVRGRDAKLLVNIGKTALITLLAGLFTFFVYYLIKDFVPNFTTYRFISGGLILGISGLVFAAVYLLGTNYWGIINEEERAFVTKTFEKISRNSLIRRIFMTSHISQDIKK